MNVYVTLIEAIFKDHYTEGATSFEFLRTEIKAQATKLNVKLPENLGDLIYTFRYREELPESILATCGEGETWAIEGTGRAKYRFRKVRQNRIEPREGQYQIKIPDATPEIIACYSLNDEQAALARVRYNRLIDIFLGITAYSLQNHLRTHVKELGQIEIDELYVGINKTGSQFIIPVQAKGGDDKIGVTQIEQDIRFCETKFQRLLCRPVAVQFIKAQNVVVMFLLDWQDGELKIVEERHYKLVPSDKITDKDLKRARE